MNLKQIFILFFTFCFFSVLLSVSTTWTGNVSNNWHNPGNWDNGVPDQTMDAVIPLQSSYARDPIVSSGDAPCANLSNYGNLSVQNDFSLNVQNNCDCDLMGSIELFNGNVNVGGTMENFGNVVVSDEFAAGTSNINCNTYEARVGSTTNIQANGSLTCTQFNAVNQSTTNLNSGELSCTHLNDNGSIAENGGTIACDDFAMGPNADVEFIDGNFNSTGGGTFADGSTLDLEGNASFRFDGDVSFDGTATIDDNATLWAGGSDDPNFVAGPNSILNLLSGYFSIGPFVSSGTVTINGGNAYWSSSDNYGTFNFDSGSANTYDGFTNYCTFNQTGGTGNFGGGFTLETGSTNQQSGGTLNIGGDATFNSSIINTGPNGEMVFNGGGIQQITNPSAMSNTNMLPSVIVNNNSMVSFDDKTSFAVQNLEIDNGTLKVNSGYLQCYDPPNGELVIGPNGTLELSGTNTLPNFGTNTFDSTSEVVYNSLVNDQPVAEADYQNLGVYNAQKVLSGNVSVAQELTLNSVVDIGNYDLSLLSGATLNHSLNSFVATTGSGYLIIEDVSSANFPVAADLSSPNGVNIDNKGVNVDLGVKVSTGITPNHPNAAYCLQRTWDIIKTGVLYADITLNWLGSHESTTFEQARLNSKIIGNVCHTPPSWQVISTPSGATGAGIIGDPYRYEMHDIAIVSGFCLGDADHTLPVTLSSFTGICQEGIPTLYWTTQSETDNLGWNIYRSLSENGWNENNVFLVNTDIIPGMGTTSEETDYSFQDIYDIVEDETYYYWLESVSISGDLEIYGPVSVLVEIEEEPIIIPDLPEITKLKANFPNPFNPVTKIEFDIKEGEIGIFSIFNVLGQKLQERKYDAGFHSYNWNADEQASGIYFFSLKTSSYSEIKKMLLLK